MFLNFTNLKSRKKMLRIIVNENKNFSFSFIIDYYVWPEYLFIIHANF